MDLKNMIWSLGPRGLGPQIRRGAWGCLLGLGGGPPELQWATAAAAAVGPGAGAESLCEENSM